MVDRDLVIAQIEQLKKDYADDLPIRLEKLEHLFGLFRSGNAKYAIAELIHMTHNLAGSASIYGYTKLGSLASSLEEKLVTLNADVELAEDDVKEIAQLVQSIVYFGGMRAEVTGQNSSSILPCAHDAKTILVVDDSPEFTNYIESHLRIFGYDVVTVNSLDSVGREIARVKPAVIMMDISFPEGRDEGIRAIDRLVADKVALPPFIFLSNRADIHARIKAVASGCDAYLVKPVDLHLLSDVLDELTQKEKGSIIRILMCLEPTPMLLSVQEILRAKGMEVYFINKLDDFYHTISELNPDVLLISINALGVSGMDLAKTVIQDKIHPCLSVIFYDEPQLLNSHIQEILGNGFQFISSSLEHSLLSCAIEGYAEKGRLIKTLMAKDSLTGLLHHKALSESLYRELAIAERYSQELSYVLIDLDDFKYVNDTFGHLAGDMVIKKLTTLLKRRLRACDLIGRYGGEEFAVIMPNTNAMMALKAIDMVREEFVNSSNTYEGYVFDSSFSAGIAGFPYFSDENSLVKEADKALYLAKGSGKNCIKISGPQ